MPATTFSFITLSVLLCLLSFAPRAQSFINFEPIKTFYEAPIMTRFGNLAMDDRGHLCTSVKNQGLHCYDGVHIKTLYKEYVAGIVNNKEQVWGATNKKIFNVSGGELIFLHNHLQPELEQEEKIIQVFEDEHSNLLILTNRGLHRLYEESVEKIYHSDDETIYFAASDDSADFVWISSSEGVYLYNVTTLEKRVTFKQAIVYEITDTFYLSKTGIYRRDTNERLFDGEFFRSFQLSDNDWLVTGHRGICRMQNFEQLTCHSSFVGASDDNIMAFSLLGDAQGNIFAITNDGLYVSQPKFYQNFTQRHGLFSNRVLSLFAVDESLYVGTSHGLNRFDVKTGEVSAIAGTEDMDINSIAQVGAQLWLGVTGKGVYAFDIAQQKIASKLIDVESRIYSIMPINEVVYLAVQNEGIFKYDKSGNLLLSRTQSHFQQIRKIVHCNDSLFVGSTMDGLIKLNTELVIQDYTNAINLHTFICQDNKIVAGSRTGELQTLNFNLQVKNSLSRHSPIYTILPYQSSFLAINEKGLLLGEQQRLIEMPISAFLNVWHLDNNTLYFGSSKGLYRVDLQEAERFEAPAPIMNLTLNSIDGGQLLHLRTKNMVKSSDYQWFLSYDNKTFALMPDNDIFIPDDSWQSVFVYLKDDAGQATPVKKFSLSQQILQVPSLSGRFYDILTGMLLFTFLYALFYDRNSLILPGRGFLSTSKLSPLVRHHESSLECDQDKKEKPANSQSDKDDEQTNLDIDVVRALVSKIDKGRGHDYHQTRVAQFNQLLRKRQKYLQGKEISAAIDMSENQLRFSLKTVFGNGSIKAYIPIYLDIIKEEEGYDTQ